MSQSLEAQSPVCVAGDLQVWGGVTSTWCGGGGTHSPEEGWEPAKTLPINSPFLAFITLALLLTHFEGHFTRGYGPIQSGRRGSKLLGDSTGTFSAVSWQLGQESSCWVKEAGGGCLQEERGCLRRARSKRRCVLGGFGGRGPLSIRCCTNPQSPGSEFVELHGATVIQTVNKICG